MTKTLATRRTLLLVLGLFIVLCDALSPGAVQAQSTMNCRISFEEWRGNDQQNAAILNCPFAGTEQDAVHVFDRASNMLQADDWQSAVDFEDDLWVFDAGGDGKAELVIDFHRDGPALIADLFDDQDGDGQVSYSLQDGFLAISEAGTPTVRVIAADGWWQAEGRVNYNLDIHVFGRVRSTFALSDPSSLPEAAPGDPAYTIEVRDTDLDGRPDYDLRQVLLPLRLAQGTKTELSVNTDRREIPPTEGAFFWPHLGPPTDYIKRHGTSPAPIQVDWSSARLLAVGEFVASRSSDANWFIYSLLRFAQDGETYANFENPFAFYDMAADRDGVPELAIRAEYYGPGDPAFFGERFQTAIEGMRYSWDQGNDGFWDYSLVLLGRHEIAQVVEFPDFAVQTVPYAEYPDWVVGQAWDTASFVAVEDDQYSSSEGIYEGWVSSWRNYYITGFANEPGAVSDIERPGLRMDYTPELLALPQLYLSAVDHRLHLRHAQGGMWNVDSYQRVRYADLDGDGYFDQWRVTVQPSAPIPSDEVAEETATEDHLEETVMSLQFAADMLVYADSGQVRLIRTMVEPSLFETLPPSNHEDWVALRELLDQHAADLPPDGLLQIAEQFPGPTTQISRATLAGFRLTEDGFRFVLDLRPGFQVTHNAEGLDVDDLTDGSYLVTYDGEFRVRTFTPPHLLMPQGGLASEPPIPRQGEWTEIKVVLQNSGLQDATLESVRLYAAQGEGQPLLVGEKASSVPGEGEAVLEFSWWPPEAGEWTVWVEADMEEFVRDGTDLDATSSLALDVKPASMPHMFRPLQSFDGMSLTWPVILLLTSAGLAAMAVLFTILRYTLPLGPEAEALGHDPAQTSTHRAEGGDR